MKEHFGSAIAARLAMIDTEANFAEGRVNSVIQCAQDKFRQTDEEPRKFGELDGRLQIIYVPANRSPSRCRTTLK